ncbi:hypothetical protein [Streptomyces sp. NPDC005303]|uniref:hypothetical protein n=1 Tax=Streptomyces sp. NPDC005303 TaxID=3155713 RepID=UPI0033A05B4B
MAATTGSARGIAWRRPDKIRNPAELLLPQTEVSDAEIEGALALTGPEFEDAYTDAMAKIIEAKREHRALPEAPEPRNRARCSTSWPPS